MTPEIREYARKALLDAKLKVIKKSMEPVTPTENRPFPNNSFHQWNEKMRNQSSYEEIVDFEFMRIISTETPSAPQAERFLE